MDVWLEVCHAYAQQLAAKGETHAAVSFLVCCNRATDAVRLYLAAGAFACVAIAPVCPWLSVRHSFRFPLSLVSGHAPTSDRHRLSLCREALALAKTCLRPGDALITEVLEAWALWSEQSGSCEQAAKWQVVLLSTGLLIMRLCLVESTAFSRQPDSPAIWAWPALGLRWRP
jgi:hypothetical protein